jgi:hypothetical protein
MYARLWWKDARQFWPIWVFLASAAAMTQTLVLHFVGREARYGLLGLLALGWTCLYAFAVGAAAFAGERETGTLRLLDVLGAGRRTVWAGKVSFALVTTLALGLVLLTMAAQETEHWVAPQERSSFWDARSHGGVVLVALGWGLLCSAVLSNALAAAVLAIVCTGLSWSALMMGHDVLDEGWYWPHQVVLGELAAALATMVASNVAFNWSLRPRRLRFQIQSPILVKRDTSPRPSRVHWQLQSPVGPAKAEPLPELELTPAVEEITADQPRPRSWIAEARALAWQTRREGRWTWWILLLPIALALPLLISGAVDIPWFVLVNTGVALTAGVNVFNRENRAHTHRFLAHHGARPGLVWLVKLMVWVISLGMVWAVLIARFLALPVPPGVQADWVPAVLALPIGFAVAQLCGMAIPRGITAWVVSMVATLALAIPGIGLVIERMLPAQGLLAIPLALLTVSWAWSDDWLFDRPAPGRWIRLGAILAGMSAVLSGGYAASRAWGVPDASPVSPPLAWVLAAPIMLPADQDAAELYRQAGQRLAELAPEKPEFLNRNRESLEILRRAAAQPNCRFTRPERLTIATPLSLPPMVKLAGLIGAAARDRQRRGDLAGAWDDIVVIFRMARHLDEGAAIDQALQALAIERLALDRAIAWTIAPGQTPDRLRAALAAYREPLGMPPAAEVVRAEAQIVEQSLDHLDEVLVNYLHKLGSMPAGELAARHAVWSTVVALPWERVRAHRVTRRLFNAAIEDASLEPWQQPRATTPSTAWKDPELYDELMSTPLLKLLFPNIGAYVEGDYRNEVSRRALVQILAIRAWQLRHNGTFPDRLEALVPEDLTRLPIDPYSGKPFGYGLEAGELQAGPDHQPGPRSQSETRLLFSVGPNGREEALSSRGSGQATLGDDIVFAIPPLTSPSPPKDREAGSGGVEGQGQTD